MAESITGFIFLSLSPNITAADRTAHYPSYETYYGLHFYPDILFESEKTICRASFQRRATQA